MFFREAVDATVSLSFGLSFPHSTKMEAKREVITRVSHCRETKVNCYVTAVGRPTTAISLRPRRPATDKTSAKYIRQKKSQN